MCLVDAPGPVLRLEGRQRGESPLTPLLEGAPACADRVELAREHDEPQRGADDGGSKRNGHVHRRAALVRQASSCTISGEPAARPRPDPHREQRRVDWRVLQALPAAASSTVMLPIFCTASETASIGSGNRDVIVVPLPSESSRKAICSGVTPGANGPVTVTRVPFAVAFFVDPSSTVVPSAPVGMSKMSAEAGVTAALPAVHDFEQIEHLQHIVRELRGNPGVATDRERRAAARRLRHGGCGGAPLRLASRGGRRGG